MIGDVWSAEANPTPTHIYLHANVGLASADHTTITNNFNHPCYNLLLWRRCDPGGHRGLQTRSEVFVKTPRQVRFLLPLAT